MYVCRSLGPHWTGSGALSTLYGLFVPQPHCASLCPCPSEASWNCPLPSCPRSSQLVLVPTGCSSPFQSCVNTTSRQSYLVVQVGSLTGGPAPQSQQTGCQNPLLWVPRVPWGHILVFLTASAMRLPFLAHPLPEPLVGGPSFHCPPCLLGAAAACESLRGIYRHLKCKLKIASCFLNLHLFLFSVRGWNLCLSVVDPQLVPI